MKRPLIIALLLLTALGAMARKNYPDSVRPCLDADYMHNIYYTRGMTFFTCDAGNALSQFGFPIRYNRAEYVSFGYKWMITSRWGVSFDYSTTAASAPPRLIENDQTAFTYYGVDNDETYDIDRVRWEEETFAITPTYQWYRGRFAIQAGLGIGWVRYNPDPMDYYIRKPLNHDYYERINVNWKGRNMLGITPQVTFLWYCCHGLAFSANIGYAIPVGKLKGEYTRMDAKTGKLLDEFSMSHTPRKMLNVSIGLNVTFGKRDHGCYEPKPVKKKKVPKPKKADSSGGQ